MKHSFFEQVYQVVQAIPEGKVATYGQIAKLLGTRDARRVGHALHANSSFENVPCHRVVNRLGGLAQSYAFGGQEVQKALLLREGVLFNNDGAVDIAKCLVDEERLCLGEERKVES